MRLFSVLSAAAVLLVATACCSRSTDSPSTSPGGEGAGAGEENPYAIEVRAPEKAAVGVEATAEIVVTPRSGYKINLEYPAKLVLSGVPAGTKVAAETVTKAMMSIEQKRLSVPIRFTAEGPGAKTFSGELRFSVCNPQTCQMPRETVSFTTVAEGEAPAPGGDAAPAEAPGDGGAVTP